MDIHREDKIHECGVCHQKFQTRPILRKHMKKHDVDYQNQCVSVEIIEMPDKSELKWMYGFFLLSKEDRNFSIV